MLRIPSVGRFAVSRSASCRLAKACSSIAAASTRLGETPSMPPGSPRRSAGRAWPGTAGRSDQLSHRITKHSRVSFPVGQYRQNRTKASRGDKQQGVVEFGHNLPDAFTATESGRGTAGDRKQSRRHGGQLISLVKAQAMGGTRQPVSREQHSAAGMRNTLDQAAQQPAEIRLVARGDIARHDGWTLLREGAG